MQRWNKRLGLWLIASPFIGFAASLLVYAITSYVIASLSSGSGDLYSVVGRIILVICGLLGVLSVFGFFITVPLGFFHYLNAKRFQNAGKKEKPSLSAAELEEQVKRWNWGAFLFGTIWGLSNGVWISLLLLVPIVNIIMMFYLGVRGNELAWKAGYWDSVASFHKTQRRWVIPAIVYGVFMILLLFLQVLFAQDQSQATSQATYNVCDNMVRNYYTDTSEGRELNTYFDRGCFLEAGCMDDVEDSDFVSKYDYCNRAYYDDCYASISQRVEEYIQSSVDACVTQATTTE